MKGKNYKYNIFKDGKLVDENLTNKEVQKKYGLSEKSNIGQYVRRKMKLKEVYTVEYAKTQNQINASEANGYFTEQMLKEWRYMNKIYGKKVVVSKMETV